MAVLKSRNILDDDETPEDLSEILISQIAGALFPIVKVSGGQEESFIDIETLTEVLSKFLILKGTAIPSTSLLTEGRRAIYLRTVSDGQHHLYWSEDGTEWTLFNTGNIHIIGEDTDIPVGTQENQVLWFVADRIDLTGFVDTDGSTEITTASAGDVFVLISATWQKLSDESDGLTEEDREKLDGIEDEATADQTGAEIKTAYEAEDDTNAFTDDEKSKLENTEEDATKNQAGAGTTIGSDGEVNIDNPFTEEDESKLDATEVEATADQTGAEIKVAYEAEDDTNAFTDDEKTKLDGIQAEATHAVLEYAGTNSDTESDWHEIQETTDKWVRVNVNGTAGEGIPLTEGSVVEAEYAQTDSSADDDWHHPKESDDDWIRFVLDGVAQAGIPLTEGTGGDGGSGESGSELSPRSEVISMQLVGTVDEGEYSAAINITATDPISVEYPPDETTPELVSIPTAGGTEVNFEKAGIYDIEWDASVDTTVSRAYPSLLVYASDATIGTTAPLAIITTQYLREAGTDDKVYGSKTLQIGSDDTLVKFSVTSVGNFSDTAFNVDAGSMLRVITRGLIRTGELSNGGVAGEIDITIGRDDDSITVRSSSGEDGVIQAATASLAGAMSAAQASKLEDIEEEATKNQAGAGTTIGSDGEVNIDNEFTEDDETKLDGIGAEATKNTAGDGIVVANDGETSVDDEYVDGLIEGSTHYLDSFRVAYTTAYSTTTGTRWTTQQQSDLTGYLIRINPGDLHVAVLQALREDSKIQVRNVDETVNNSFTLEADPADPDSVGTWTLFGEWDETPNFVQSHNYRLLFSVRRETSIHTDDDSLDGTGTEDDPVKVKDDGIGADEIDSSLSSADKATVRESLDAPNGVYIAPANVAVSGNGTLYTLTTDVPERVGLEVVFEAKADSGGSTVSLRFGSGAIRSVRRTDGNSIGTGELKNGQLVRVTWNGSQYKSNIAPPPVEIEDSTAENTSFDSTDGSGVIPDTVDDVQGAIEELDAIDDEDIPTNTSDFGDHIPTSADNLRKALKALNDNEYLFHRTVQRTYRTSGPLTQTNQIIIEQHGTTGTVYNLDVSRHTGAEALPEAFLNHLGRFTPIKVVSDDGTVVWRGELVSVHDDDETSATLRIDFANERTGTFSNNETVHLSFGVAILSRLIASAIELSVDDFDGLFADFGDDNLQDLLNYIDDLVAQNIPIDEDNLEGLLSGLTHLNVQEAFERIDRLTSHDEDNHFFSITPADLGSDKIGYAAAAHTDLNNAGGSNPNHSLVSGLFHEYDADLGYRWHLLYNEDATGISGTDTTYGGPSLHALDGSGITGRVINMFFRVNLLADDELFNPFGSSLDLDPHSDSRINEGLRVFEVRWLSSSRQLRLNRRTNDVSTMSAYWETGTPPESELKDIWLLTENDGLVKIDADWFDEAGSGYARWNIPLTETAVLDAMNGLETNQHCLLVIADEDSVGSTPDYIRAYDDGFYLQLKIGDDPIETKWMRPASYNPGVWHWVSDWEELEDAPTVAGTAYEAAVYDVEGAGQYTADAQVTLHEDVARADQLGPTFVTFRHYLMDEQFREYTPVQLYPQDGEIAASRRNIYRPRKFVFGRVEGSSNGGLPIPNIDIRSGSRGNVDYHQGEVVGSDLLKLTALRPDKGTWRIEVELNALTKQADDAMSISLLRVNTDENFFIGQDFVEIGDLGGNSRFYGLAIDSDGNAYSLQDSNNYLVSVDLETAAATRIGAVSSFGVGETDPRCIAFTQDGTCYFSGRIRQRLHTLNTSTGRATQVGTMGTGFGIGEVFPSSFAAIGNDLFMTGLNLDCISQLNTTTGGASRIGDIAHFGQGSDIGSTYLIPIGDRMLMYGAISDRFYEVNLEDGSAMPLNDDTNLNIRGLTYRNGVIYSIDDSGLESLFRSNVLDLPVAIGEGIGVPVKSRYNFPGYNDESISAKLVSIPFYTDGTQDFTLVWNLIEGTQNNWRDWLGRDFKVSLEKLAA